MLIRLLPVSILLSQLPTALAQDNTTGAGEEEVPLVLEEIYATKDRDEKDPGLRLAVNAQDLSILSPDHPAEAINSLPSVNVQMNSGQEHLIALRSPVLTGGAGQGSFLILENGLPTRSSAFGNVNALFEPVHELASDIEVVVGPASARYGSNAVHGLINFDLPSPAEASSHAELALSSLGRQKLDGLLQVTDSAVAGIAIQHDTGWRDNTSVDQQKIYLANEFTFEGWQGLVWLSATNLNQETAGFIEGTKAYRNGPLARTNPNPEAYRDARSARLAAQLVRTGDAVDVRITPYVRWQDMAFRQHFLPYKGVEENGHHAAGVQTRADWRFTGDVTLRFGADSDFASGFLIETQADPFGFFPGDTRFPVGVHYDYDVDTSVFALWSELDWQVSDQLSLLAGLRGETHDYRYSTNTVPGINGRFNVSGNRDDAFDFFTPKLGFVWQLNPDHALFGNVARGARAPQASDLYRLQSQQLPGEARVETLDSVELGVRGAIGPSGHLSYQVAAYMADKENFFFRDSDGLNVTDGTTEHAGVDVLVRYEPIKDALQIDGALSWSDQTYTFDRPANGIISGNQIDTAPEWLADLSLSWRPVQTWSFHAEAEYIGEYFTNPANTRAYPGHVVFHAGAQYRIDPQTEFYARIRNLFDLDYADRADFAFGDERYFPGEPLNITLGFQRSLGN